MIRVQIYGVEAARDRLGRIPEHIERAITAFAERVHELAMDGAGKHEKTGALVDSLGYGPKKIRGGWEIGHSLQRAPYAAFVHWGTRPHPIPKPGAPRKKKALRWAGGGGFVFAKSVNHPGYKGDPWLVKAAEQAAREFPQFMRAVKV